MPTRELVLKIARLAGDERGDAATRAIAFAKLEALRAEHPHLFVLEESPPTAEDAAPWSDVADVADDAPQAPPPTKGKARFMDIRNWKATAAGNPTITATVRGVEFRVVLFKYKRSPAYGFLIINTDTDKETFSERRYPTEVAAHEGAWDALSAI
jgi:hypothetical protein